MDNHPQENEKNSTKSSRFRFTGISKLSDEDRGLKPIQDAFKLHPKNEKVGCLLNLFRNAKLNEIYKSNFVAGELNTEVGHSEILNSPYKNYNSSFNCESTEIDPNNMSIEFNSNVSKFGTFNKSKISSKIVGSSDYNVSKIKRCEKNDMISEFLSELNTLNSVAFRRDFERKKEKFDRHFSLMKVIMGRIIEATEEVERYQKMKNVEIIDNLKWEELMYCFLNDEKFTPEPEENSVDSKEEFSEYQEDYGELLGSKDKNKIFDYQNYIGLFNDNMIPERDFMKKFTYPELYKEF